MSASPFAYRTSPTKRFRRSKAEITTIKDAIIETLTEDHPQTNRGVFYRVETAGVIDKTDAEYKTTVCRLLKELRLARVIPFGWIADSTRWMRKPETHGSGVAALESCARTYRRSVWSDLPVYTEIWVEKDALAGVVYKETGAWDVPLMVTRGYPSITYLYEAAEHITNLGKPTYIYYFGDLDPSGVDIPRTVEKGLREFAPDAEIHFERVAVTREQVRRWKLPTRPTKKTDTRSRSFKGDSVELDAIPAKVLRALVRGCIEQHIPRGHIEHLEMVEAEERQVLDFLAKAYRTDRDKA